MVARKSAVVGHAGAAFTITKGKRYAPGHEVVRKNGELFSPSMDEPNAPLKGIRHRSHEELQERWRGPRATFTTPRRYVLGLQVRCQMCLLYVAAPDAEELETAKEEHMCQTIVGIRA
jgi:hypothetical protein